jgi:uncharacterized protein
VLTQQLLAGSVPGVIIGAIVRLYLVPGPRPFRIIAAVVLLSIGAWLLWRTLGSSRVHEHLSDRRVFLLALGIGIGGGSILSPILVGSGMAVARVAPAALASTFGTSIVGAITYAVLALFATGSMAPHWTVGIASGLGGLIGGYLGALVQPHVPEQALRLLLGTLAIAIGCLYLAQGLT